MSIARKPRTKIFRILKRFEGCGAGDDPLNP
jgi:hypothetical protein